MLRTQAFTGSFPVVPNHMLPEQAAQYAKNCEVRHGELKPLAGAATVFSGLPSGTKGVYTPDGYHILASQTPMHAYLSPTVGDINDRVYFTNGSGLRVCKWSDAGPTGVIPQSWKVGVPAPSTALTVRKVRKNRWPNYPNTQLKATVFLESENGRHFEEGATLAPVAGSIPFSKYTATTSTDAATILETVKENAKNPPLHLGESATVVGVTLTSAQSIGGQSYAAGTLYLPYSYLATVAGASVTLQAQNSEGAQETAVIPAASITHVVSLDGTKRKVVFAAPSVSTSVIPENARYGMEVWLENADNTGERIWTVFTTTSSSGSISQIPGSGEVTLRATSPTTFEINMTFGVIEDRAYVYTIFNDWQEESMPSDPAIASVTYLDDVVLQVDYDACVEQLAGYRPLDHLQFYRATNGEYVAVKTAPASMDDVTGLYTNLLGRDPDAEGLAYWEAQYNAGTSLSDIASAMMRSREYRDATAYLAVEDLYRELLDRAPDDAGFAYWRGMYESGTALETIALGFLQSPEFIPGKHASMPSVTWFYNAILNRAPDADGLAYWNAQIAAHGVHGNARMVAAMLMSSEYKTANAARHLTYMMTTVLGRAPTGPELAAAQAKYAAGFSLNAITAQTSAITTDGFKDEGGTLPFTLASLEWNEPPAGIEKLTILPNGVFAAAIDNYIYFSEPYRPHAWPADYGQAIPDSVVAQMAFDGQLLVVTTGSPVMLSGAHPQGMTQQRIGAQEAAASSTGLTIANGRPVYASKEGLVMIEGLSGSLAMSNNFFTAEKWREKYGARVADIVLTGFDSRVIGLFPSGDGFIINMSGTPNLVEFSQVAGYPFSIPGEEALYLATPAGRVKMFFGEALPYVWWSKEFTLPSAQSFGAVKLVHNGPVTMTFCGDGQQFHTVTLPATAWRETHFRLPAKRYTRFSYKIESSAMVQEVHIGFNMREIGRV